MNLRDECSPAQLHLDEATCTTETTTDQGNGSTVDSTAGQSVVDVVAHALAYARAGFPVLPVHSPVGVPGAPPCPCRRPGCEHRCSCMDRGCAHPGKHPRTRNGAKDATTDVDVITRWCTTWSGTNLGLVPPVGVVVVDVDPRDGGASNLAALVAAHGHLSPTWTAWTGGGGLHAWYRAPGPYRGKLCPGVDLKCHTGYVVAAPSLHASGRRYTWGNELPIAVAPRWLAELMVAPARTLASPVHAGLFSGAGDDGLVRFVADSVAGERNGRLYWAGRRAAERGGGADVFNRLRAAALEIGLGAEEIERTLSSAAQAGAA